MVQEVRAADGRSWTVRREINWSRPAHVQEFEHDVAVGQVAGVVMVALVIFMVAVIVLWTPAGVFVPGWLILAFVALVLLVPAQWVMARSWTIVADTYEPLETSGEQWVGTVRGLMASRREVSRVARHLERHAIPDDGQGPLQPVSSSVRLPSSELGE